MTSSWLFVVTMVAALAASLLFEWSAYPVVVVGPEETQMLRCIELDQTISNGVANLRCITPAARVTQ